MAHLHCPTGINQAERKTNARSKYLSRIQLKLRCIVDHNCQTCCDRLCNMYRLKYALCAALH